jgi:hypothetical protein
VLVLFATVIGAAAALWLSAVPACAPHRSTSRGSPCRRSRRDQSTPSGQRSQRVSPGLHCVSGHGT